MMDLHDILERVDSRESFLTFIQALREDLQASQAKESANPSSLYGPAAGGWENPSLDRYLEAMQAWTGDMGGRIDEPPSWRTFADILYAAKIYE